MKVTLRPVIVLEPDADARRAWDRALDLIADAIAEQIIAEARAEVAAELGLGEEDLQRERESLTETARASIGFAGGGQ